MPCFESRYVQILPVDDDKDLRQFLENEQLRAAGPFTDDEGALWVLEAETAEAAEEIVKGDPYVEAGAIVSWNIRPLSYCLHSRLRARDRSTLSLLQTQVVHRLLEPPPR